MEKKGWRCNGKMDKINEVINVITIYKKIILTKNPRSRIKTV